MALKPLSRIVHVFMAKWLLLPALLGLVCGSAVWIGVEAKKIQKEQVYYARTVAQQVHSYLQHNYRQLKQFAHRLHETGYTQGVLPLSLEYKPSILAVHVLDPSGRVVQSWPQESERINFSKTIQSASPQGKLYLTQPYYSIPQDDLVVGMLVAASGGGRLILGELNLAAIQESIQSLTQHMGGGHAFLTDAHGNLLAHPDMTMFDQQVNLGDLDIISHLPRGEAKSGFYRRNGDLRFMSATSVRLSHWKVGVSQSALSLLAPTLWTIALSLAGFLALLGGSTLMFDRRLQRMIVRPLTRFTQDLDALEQGEPPIGDSEKILSTSENCSELWSLQKNFQTMQRTVRQRETALRQSENYYRTLFETSGTAMFIVEEDTTISLVNFNFEKLSGYPRSDVEGKKSWTEFVYPEDLGRMKESHYQRRQDPDAAPHQYEFRFITRHGELRNLFSTIDIIPGTNRSIISGIDITERKKIEQELRESEYHFHQLFENAPIGIFIATTEHTIVEANQTALSILGYSREEILRVSAWELIHADDLRADSPQSYLQKIFSHETVATERRFRTRQGEYIHALVNMAKLPYYSEEASHMIMFQDITDRKRYEERIYHLAYYDELTALPNRRLFHDQLKQVTARSEHFGEGDVVFLVDITRLKEVNDTLGQQAGDELIGEVARRLVDTVFEEDTVARVSGGEFMILSEGKTTNEEALNLGLRILERIGRRLELSGRLVYPEVNIGYTIFPQRATDPETLIKQADIALSEAKKSASRIQEFAWQEDWISRQFHLEHDLKQALRNEEFFLCYQPQIDLRTGRIVGLEALLRWEHPERGIVSPGEFIPVLEHTRMIASADEWVIHRVCKQLKFWQDSGIFVKTSVNLSAQELTSDATIEVVRAALEENNVLAENLEVEITETGLMENVDWASGILQTLSSWGVKVALDDFGKGYSSLSYLHKLDINIIKIDKQFVDGLPENEGSITLLQTIIAMAHNMGKEVLAEGVEREEQRQKLCELGCDYGQGFLWSRPQPVECLTLTRN